jgi:hypothetical protein
VTWSGICAAPDDYIIRAIAVGMQVVELRIWNGPRGRGPRAGLHDLAQSGPHRSCAFGAALNAHEFITAAVRGTVTDSGHAQLARWVFLIAEAEVDCDKDGIDSFVDRYGARSLTHLGCPYESIGAAELAALVGSRIQFHPQTTSTWTV